MSFRAPHSAHGARGPRLAAVACLFWLVLIWAWPPAYLTLTVDDSFYYLRIAQNLAAGLGPTFDGVEPTNGFHPLWVGLLTMLASAATIDTAARLALTIGALLTFLTALLLERVTRDSATALAILLLNFWSTKVFINGMESALVAALMTGCLMAPERAGIRWGALAGLLTLARLDALMFVLPWLVVRRGATLGLALVVVPWLAFGYLYFGHIIPVSSAVKHDGIPVGVLLAAPLVALGTVAWRRHRLWPLVAYALGALAIGGWTEIWRMVPLALFLCLWLPRSPRWALRPGVALWLVASLVLWRHRLSPASYSSYLAARGTGQWLREHTSATARIGGWDCGIAAAYSRRTFFQLEGLVGSWDLFSHLERGQLSHYLDSRGVGWIAQPVRLPATPVIAGLDLGNWRVRRAECVQFTPVLEPGTTSTRMYLVLERRGDGRSLAELLAAPDPCALARHAP